MAKRANAKTVEVELQPCCLHVSSEEMREKKKRLLLPHTPTSSHSQGDHKPCSDAPSPKVGVDANTVRKTGRGRLRYKSKGDADPDKVGSGSDKGSP